MKFILVFLFSLSAMASNDSLFCKEVIENSNIQKPHVSTLSIMRGSIFPHKVVFLDQLRSFDDGFIRKQGSNHIVLNMIEQWDKNQGDELKKNVAIYKEIQKKISNNNFAKKLLNLNNEQECLNLISQKKDDYRVFLELSQKLKKYLPFQKSFERLESQSFIKGQISLLRNRGWIVHDALTFDVLHRINQTDVEQLILVTHVSKNGAISDFFGNTIPSNIFANTATTLRKLSIFSCYTDEVQKTYHIKKLMDKGRFDYVYPIVQPAFRKLFKDTTPLFGVKALAKFHKNLVYMPKRELKENCSVHLSRRVNNLALFINNKFIGMVNKNLHFYCDILKDKNTITFNLVNNSKPKFSNIKSILPNEALIRTQTSEYQYNMKHFIRNNEYRSSKSFQ